MEPTMKTESTRPTRGPRSALIAGVAAAGILCAALVYWGGAGPKSARAHDRLPGPVVQVYSVGGVLTADGKLWQYHPEQKKWLTIDDAFRAQGKETKILPLPVAAAEIHEMETWGFLVTRSGACWLYDLERNRWEELPSPPRG